MARSKNSNSHRVARDYAFQQLKNMESSDLNSGDIADLEQLKKDFNQAQIQLFTTISSEEQQREWQVTVQFEKMFRSLRQKLRCEKPSLSSAVEARSSRVKLPKININSFDGRMTNWVSFIELYNSLIHSNSSLTEVEKMHYLLSSVKGRALDLIKNIPISSDNYVSAYNALQKEYNKPRQLANSYYENLLSCEPMQKKCCAELKRITQTFSENLSVLEKYNLPDKNFMLFHLLWSKLDRTTKEAFELEQNSVEIPLLSSLLEFLDKHIQALEWTNLKEPNSATSVRPFKPSHVRRSALVASSSSTCPACPGKHGLSDCKKFLEMNTQSRYRFVKQKNLCLICLTSGHRVNDCASKSRCNNCAQNHHTLLHFEKPSVPISKETVALTTTGVTQTTLFATARVAIKNKFGKYVRVRALLDSASACNFISLKCARALGLNISRGGEEISGIGHSVAKCLGTVSGTINALDRRPNENLNFDAFVLPSICPTQPSKSIDCSNWAHIRPLKLADPDFNRADEIDLLLGANIFASILLPGVVVGSPGQPKAIATQLGWVIMGEYKDNSVNENSHISRQCLVAVDPVLNSTIKKFWEIEDVNSNSEKIHWSEKDKQCESLFIKNHGRTREGRFVVPLPFVDPSSKPNFVDSRQLALKRFISLERKLASNPDLKKAYTDFMIEYETLGHMEEVRPPKGNTGKYYYIPHHGILRPESVSTPLRVVFDASAKDTNSRSLNDTLLPGPKLQTNIFDLLLRFRWHSVVFTGDIQKMYRQILVPGEDADYQRILWRPTPDIPIRDFRLKTVTYGVASAPFQALRVIAQIAQDCRIRFPEVSTVLSRDIYVDDIVTGADSVVQAKNLRDGLVETLGSGGFHLRKWASNHKEFFSDIAEDDLYSVEFRQFDDNSIISLKILGLLWIPASDSFTFRIGDEDRKCTKRTILSEIARIFDPLGFLCPLTFLAKYLIQLLWISGVSWDDHAPLHIAEQWVKFKRQLPALTAVSLPRRMIRPFIKLQVHGFCDASERGYCAAIYCRSSITPDEHIVELACAKSKVAPLRTLTIPRLELQAAVLLADLMQAFLKALEPLHEVHDIFAWSDSKVALAWIKSCPSTWKTFIANRVSHIQEYIPPESWRHVSSSDNPADLGSRGVFPEELVDKIIWWNGPHWLGQSEDKWPKVEPLKFEESFDISKEQKILSLVVAVETHPIETLLTRFSSLKKVTHILAYCLRFIKNCRLKSSIDRTHDDLQPLEIEEGLKSLIFHTQQQVFSSEIEHLKKGTPNKLSKPLRKLSPFLDGAGFVRVGGRLKHSSLTFDNKHPYLLPRTHRFTTLLIRDYHNRFLHPGTQALHCLLVERFWILSAKRAIESVTRHCIRCFRVSPSTGSPPLMGNLPTYRITQSKPFSTVAVDYGGPFDLALGKGRGVKTFKGYICVFVCAATKAIHLELASELSTEAFLAALKRFVARRGNCSHIVSDQGRNFIGAHNHLNSLMKTAAQGATIKFSFNPPGSPHFNGLAEAGIKSVKTHLARVIGSQRLTFEELYTVLVQIESILNSRPLTPVSNDPNDLTALTPSHFLTLSSPATVPEEDVLDGKIGVLNRWKLIQKFHQDFWKRWHKEYIHTLQQRSKWTKLQPGVEIGTMAILVNEQTAPLKWPLARIVALHPGSDGVCRVVTVKTATGEYKRPLVKLCPLPLPES